MSREMLPRHALLLINFALVTALVGCESGDTEAMKKAKQERISAEARAVAAEKALAERDALEKRLAAEKAVAKEQIEKVKLPEKSQKDPVDSFKQLISRTQELLESQVVVSHFVPPLDANG